MKQSDFEVSRGRTWLNANCKGKNVSFAYPPVQGKHSDCYKEIAKDKIKMKDKITMKSEQIKFTTSGVLVSPLA